MTQRIVEDVKRIRTKNEIGLGSIEKLCQPKMT